MSSHDININLNITVSVSTDGAVSVTGVTAASDASDVAASVQLANVEDYASDEFSADQLRELAAPYKKTFVISKKELEELTKDEIIALGQGMLGIEIYKRQHKDEVVAEFWREYKARY